MKKHLLIKEIRDTLEDDSLALKARHEEEIQLAYLEIRKYSKLYQEACPHKNIKSIEDFNYHKNELWHEDTCQDCGKILKRY